MSLVGSNWSGVLCVIIAIGCSDSGPITSYGDSAVIFFKEKFRAEKGVSLALSLWGLLSYFYGDIKQSYSKKPDPETEMASSLPPNTLESSVEALVICS